MEWLAENWFWVLIGIGFIVMHMFGHGGHRGHGKHDDEDNDQKQKKQGTDSGHGHH